MRRAPTWPEREFNFGPSTTRRKLGRPGIGKHRHMRRAAGLPGANLTGFNGQICGPISWGAKSLNTLHKNLIRNEQVPAYSGYHGKGKCAVVGHRPLDTYGWCSRCHEQIAPPEPISEEVDE